MSGWYYERDDGEVLGPLSEDELKHCAERGGIALNSTVMHQEKTKGEWIIAKKITGLRARINAATTEQPESQPVVKQETSRQPRDWKRRFSDAKASSIRGLAQLKVSGGNIALQISDVLNPAISTHSCPTCHGEFSAYDSPGQCPLCGDWQSVVCTSCGLSGSAQRFVQAKCKCPRCGTRVAVEGAQSGSWALVGLIGISVLAVIVLAAFVVAGIISAPPSKIVPNGVAIVAVLPNPEGQDKGREQVTVENRTGGPIDLSGWRLQDRSGNRFSLGGQIQDAGKLVVMLTSPSMSLDNGGDEVFLIDPDGVARSKVVYTADQSQSGMQVDFR